MGHKKESDIINQFCKTLVCLLNANCTGIVINRKTPLSHISYFLLMDALYDFEKQKPNIPIDIESLVSCKGTVLTLAKEIYSHIKKKNTR